MPHSLLPAPDSSAAKLSDTLKQHIFTEIAAQGGQISFARFMELALYATGLGYYNNGSVKFGAAGDFVTAPELSPLFGQCLAKQCQQILKNLGRGDILEFGPGSGKLAATILLALEEWNCLPQHYYLLELSPALKHQQRTTLQAQAPHLLERVHWLECLPATPIKGVILANEVLDAMPVHRFNLNANGLQEMYVGKQRDSFIWQLGESSNALLMQEIANIQQACPDLDYFTTQILAENNNNPPSLGYSSEINLNINPWLTSVSDCLQRGLILLLDYGFPRHEYYHPDRNQGTLMCHYRQQAHSDPFWLPGLQDITAHVDFTAVAESALACDLAVSGYTQQANFLLNCGLLNLAAKVEDTAQQFKLSQEIKYLTLPSEMGELFKAIALTRDWDFPLLGFIHQDKRHSL